jgi:hypothetical protein
MNDEIFNMSMRKFLKQVGVTSQQQLEKVAATMPEGTSSMKTKMVLTVSGTDFVHEVEGTIDLGD